MSSTVNTSLPLRPTGGQYWLHTGTGHTNVNSKDGKQSNFVQTGGHDNRQYNAKRIHFYGNHGADGRSETPPKPFISTPFARDDHFVKRPALTDQIRQKLSRTETSRAALVGLGGAGKSQLAIAYAYQHHDLCPEQWVFWIHASGAARFEKSVRDVAALVRIPGRDELGADIVQLLSVWFRNLRNGHWLIVLDNVDDASFLVEKHEFARWIDCIPTCDHGTMLVTSRDQNAASKLVEERNIIHVPPMDVQQAVDLLALKLGHDRDLTEVSQLASALEFIPLALTQAAAYLRRSRRKSSIRGYLQELQKLDESGTALLDHDHGDLRRDPEATNSIFLTWQMSFAAIPESAADLLTLMSLCDRQAIPASLIFCRDIESSDLDRTFEEDIELLMGYSFIKEVDEGSVFEMHRFVQLATRRWSTLSERISTQVDTLVSRINQAFPWSQQTNIKTCAVLFPHARSAMDLEKHTKYGKLDWSLVMTKAAEYASFQGSQVLPKQGIEMGERCWEARKMLLGDDHPDTLASMNNLAGYFDKLGDSRRAAEMGERCWEACKMQLSEDHPRTLASMNNLAGYFDKLGDSRRAAEMGERCWETCKTQLGEDHPDTLTSMSNLVRYFDKL
ncbi:hypothetical protein K431DRAFT_295506 [Polychaeton citri CBS 116435]|uniref:NB-ARC domain-containing protein n=1 Tax=Polychaeton citri CBS 116435 TaxID=1314669 RepID=A0A9P4ULC1_9PEZI|nr:hypothetical protein K431DRAFT_295506 [Polychaeton citri CBS 116435]